MPTTKWTQSLTAAAAKSAPGQALHVVVELSKPPRAAAPGSSRAEAIEAARQDFVRAAGQVKEKIQQLGGELTGEAWINSTLSARLPVDRLHELAHDEAVASIDLPHAISRDA